MRLRSSHLAIGLAMVGAAAHAQQSPAPDHPSSVSALTSPKAALQVAFEEVCLPAILDGKPVAGVAAERHLVEVNPKLAGFSGDVRTWRLTSLAHTYVVAWSDGTCSATVDRGDPEALRQAVLDAVSARGVVLIPGRAQPAQADGVNTAYCSAPPQPLTVSIITPAGPKSRRPAVFVNLFKAKSGNPSFCEPAIKQ